MLAIIVAKVPSSLAAAALPKIPPDEAVVWLARYASQILLSPLHRQSGEQMIPLAWL
jgi:hypothetical protein